MTTSQARLHEIPIRYVKGVGPHRAALLAKLGIETVEDACYYPPMRYEDRSRLVPIRDLKGQEMATVRARILTRTLERIRGGRTLMKVAL